MKINIFQNDNNNNDKEENKKDKNDINEKEEFIFDTSRKILKMKKSKKIKMK